MKKKIMSVLAALSLVLGFLPGVMPYTHAEEPGAHNTRQGVSPDYDGGVGSRHTDANKDGYCDDDNCGAHLDHTYENGYWHSGDTFHYPKCDSCEDYALNSREAHSDENDDNKCDVCGYMVGPCLHSGAAWDGVNRDFESHRMVCSDCGEEFRENHFDDDADTLCDVCDELISHSHDFGDDGQCSCGETLAVCVGGVALGKGQYLASGADKATGEEPAAGGYAYLTEDENGSLFLFLHDYTYSGEGYEYITEFGASSALYTTRFLTIVLEGSSSLTNTRGSGDGITGYDGLTITGEGTLALTAGYGIYMPLGDLIISGGTLDITADSTGIHSVNGRMTVSGGSITVVSETGNSIAAGGRLEISGGTIEAEARTGRHELLSDTGITLGDNMVSSEAISGNQKKGQWYISSEGRVTIAPGGIMVKDGQIVLINAPAELIVAAAGYTNGRLADFKFPAVSAEEIAVGRIATETITDAGISGDTIKVFFLQPGTHTPLFGCADLQFNIT